MERLGSKCDHDLADRRGRALIPVGARDVFAEGRYSYVLEGGGSLSEVPAEDVAAFIQELVRVVARAAGHAVGRPVKDTGRYESIVKAASKVRIDSVSSGSVVVTFLPSQHEIFRLGDNLGLDAETVSQAALSIARDAAGPRAADFADVARQWVELGDRMGLGRRYQRVVIRAPDRDPVTLDQDAKTVLKDVIASTVAGVEGDTVRGVLYEANFETLTAKLRNQRAEMIEVQFDLEHASEIKEALRNPTTVVGRATYDRRSHRLLSIQLEAMVRAIQTLADDFWEHRPARELLLERPARSAARPKSLKLEGVSDAEWDSFFEALGLEP
jgi:hypothetical protein